MPLRTFLLVLLLSACNVNDPPDVCNRECSGHQGVEDYDIEDDGTTYCRCGDGTVNVLVPAQKD